jgi:hypothetical protein
MVRTFPRRSRIPITARLSFPQLPCVPLTQVHVTSLATEPSGLLRHTERSTDFATAEPVLAIRNESHRNKPLTGTELTIFENRVALQRELALGTMLAALPYPCFGLNLTFE